MKRLLILPLLGLLACQQKNPQPNTSTNNGNNNSNYIECTDTDNIPWNQNVNYGSVTDVDGNEYKTVTIGGQEWMAENLKTTHYANGDEIPYVFNGDLDVDSEWGNLTTGAYCWYLVTTANGDTISYENCYGALYNGYAVEDSRNVCPTGWHVPSDNEWTVLTDYLASNGYSGNEGLALKSTEGWYSNGNDASALGTDDYGFRGLPDGARSSIGAFKSIGYLGDWWSSTESNTNSAWSRRLYYHYGDVHRGNNSKRYGFSVRCLRD